MQGKANFIYQQKSQFYNTFYIFLLIWIKFGMRDISKNVFSKYDFHENWNSESHKLPRGVYKFLSAIAHLLSPWDKSQCRRSANNIVEDL